MTPNSTTSSDFITRSRLLIGETNASLTRSVATLDRIIAMLERRYGGAPSFHPSGFTPLSSRRFRPLSPRTATFEPAPQSFVHQRRSSLSPRVVHPEDDRPIFDKQDSPRVTFVPEHTPRDFSVAPIRVPSPRRTRSPQSLVPHPILFRRPRRLQDSPFPYPTIPRSLTPPLPPNYVLTHNKKRDFASLMEPLNPSPSRYQNALASVKSVSYWMWEKRYWIAAAALVGTGVLVLPAVSRWADEYHSNRLPPIEMPDIPQYEPTFFRNTYQNSTLPIEVIEDSPMQTPAFQEVYGIQSSCDYWEDASEGAGFRGRQFITDSNQELYDFLDQQEMGCRENLDPAFCDEMMDHTCQVIDGVRGNYLRLNVLVQEQVRHCRDQNLDSCVPNPSVFS